MGCQVFFVKCVIGSPRSAKARLWPSKPTFDTPDFYVSDAHLVRLNTKSSKRRSKNFTRTRRKRPGTNTFRFSIPISSRNLVCRIGYLLSMLFLLESGQSILEILFDLRFFEKLGGSIRNSLVIHDHIWLLAFFNLLAGVEEKSAFHLVSKCGPI